jgi:hypothetical protein
VEDLDTESATMLLPYYRRKDVYDMYVNDFRRGEEDGTGDTCGSQPLSFSAFLKMWRGELSHIKISKLKSAWASCDECDGFRQRLADKHLSKGMRSAEHARYLAHLQHQRCQRKKYYKHREKARLHPDRYLSIIMDAMDQRKCELPRLTRESKTMKDALKLRQKLMACMVHGLGTYLYLATPPVPTGGNFSVHCLLRTLDEVAAARTERDLSPLPPILYLQLDNATDNKNKAMLAMCETLVREGVFEKIKVSFLLVGHTHEDIDQYFRYFILQCLACCCRL